MFKRTFRLFQEKNINNSKEQPQISKKLLELYVPNYHLIENLNTPYELKGQYLPKQKVSPFRKKPLTVIYDHYDFNKFVFPSHRDKHFGMWDFEELFGIKRWRKDSPFIKEYIRVDNQIFGIVCLFILLMFPFAVHKKKNGYAHQNDITTSNYGRFTADDLI